MDPVTAAELAARLTLLALRASIASATPLVGDRVILAPATEAVTVDSAIRELVALPKPVVCRATAPSGTLVVACTPLAAADPAEQEWFRLQQARNAEIGGYMGYLEETHGPGDHLVYAVGRPGESLTIHRSVADRWNAEYELRDAAITGDDVDNSLVGNDPVYVEARRLGAAGVLKFGAPASSLSSGMSIDILSDSTSDPGWQRAMPMLIEMARHFTRDLDTAPDSLLLPPHDPAKPKTAYRQWQEKAVLQQREIMKSLADQMARHFEGRETPPEIAAFIAACRTKC